LFILQLVCLLFHCFRFDRTFTASYRFLHSSYLRAYPAASRKDADRAGGRNYATNNAHAVLTALFVLRGHSIPSITAVPHCPAHHATQRTTNTSPSPPRLPFTHATSPHLRARHPCATLAPALRCYAPRLPHYSRTCAFGRLYRARPTFTRLPALPAVLCSPALLTLTTTAPSTALAHTFYHSSHYNTFLHPI